MRPRPLASPELHLMLTAACSHKTVKAVTAFGASLLTLVRKAMSVSHVQRQGLAPSLRSCSAYLQVRASLRAEAGAVAACATTRQVHGELGTRRCCLRTTAYHALAFSRLRRAHEVRAAALQDPGAAAAAAADEEASERMFALAAQYIVLAFALQPGKEVYRRSLGVVRELLPLPAMRAGALLAADPASAATCHERRAPLPASVLQPLAGLLRGTGLTTCHARPACGPRFWPELISPVA